MNSLTYIYTVVSLVLK